MTRPTSDSGVLLLRLDPAVKAAIADRAFELDRFVAEYLAGLALADIAKADRRRANRKRRRLEVDAGDGRKRGASR